MTKKSLARDVAVVGVGISKFGAFPDKTSRDLFVEAYKELNETIDKGLDGKDIEALYLGNFSSDQFEKQAHLAPIAASWIGLSPIPALRVEDACASGGVAFREAALAIASGLYDAVLVGGLEKMTDLPITEVTDALATAADMQFEVPAGFTFPGFYASMATAYMDKYDADPVAFNHISIKNHDNGSLNDKAQFGVPIADLMAKKKAKAEAKGYPVPEWESPVEFLQDPKGNMPIAYPLGLFDCSPVSDGGVVVLLVSADLAEKYTDNPIYLVGTGQASSGALAERDNLYSVPAASKASQDAYQMAGIEAKDIDLAEVHDCFTIAEIMATEDLGFFEKGEGWKAAVEGKTARDGSMPINTSGGLKSKGHPVGASGVAQVVEIFKQLRGEAGERQISGDPEIGLTHNVGGSGQTCVVNIFKRSSQNG